MLKKRTILHTFQANGGAQAPLATLLERLNNLLYRIQRTSSEEVKVVHVENLKQRLCLPAG